MLFLQLNVGSVGEIYKIRVTNAMEGLWRLRDLTLVDVDTKERLLFNFDKFVGQAEADIRKELPAVRPNRSILPINFYRVTITTQATSASGDQPTPDVFVRLFGERGADRQASFHLILQH